MTEMAAPTLTNIILDLQVGICMLLRPSDILALRRTCRALQFSTRQRAVWVAALHRVCLDNALFLPSFPIPDMSASELEKAAMAPLRWIKLCGAFEKHCRRYGPAVKVSPRTVRIVNDSLDIEVDYETTEFFIVPGGRYLVGYSPEGISVLDLGYTSNSDCKLVASVVPEGESDVCRVQSTPDGMGLVILSSDLEHCSIYEIYPQSETPRLIQIAHLDIDPSRRDRPAYLLPGTVIWHNFHGDKVNFMVWDYRLNHSIKFSVDVDVQIFQFYLEVIATKTAVIILSKEAVLIWAIPPLLPQPPDFLDEDENPTHMPPPLFTIPLLDGTVPYLDLIGWKMVSTWYFGSAHNLYFDVLCQDSKFHRFQILLKPDLSTASLNVIFISEPTLHDFVDAFLEDYRICEDTLVSCWFYDNDISENNGRRRYHCGVYTGITSTRFSNVISRNSPAAKMLLTFTDDNDCRLFSCPASCRIVCLDEGNNVFVLDFF